MVSSVSLPALWPHPSQHLLQVTNSIIKHFDSLCHAVDSQRNKTLWL